GNAAAIRLSIDGEAGPTILLPARLRRFRAEGLFLAVADDADASSCNACGDQRILCGVGTVLPESKVVFVGATLIAIAADDYLDIRMAGEVRGVFRKDALCVSTNVVGVVIEEDVLNVRLEFFLSRHGVGGSFNSGRSIDGNARCSICGSSVSTRHEMVAGGSTRRDALGSRGGHIADAFDRNAGCVRRAPSQGDLIASRY